MRVLHVVPTFYPATYWGGPIFSVYGLCNALAGMSDTNVQLKVLTTDAASPRLSDRLRVEGIPLRYEPGYEVYFTRRLIAENVAPGLLVRLWRMVQWADIVHLTATYSFSTIPTLALCRLFKKPLVWSPRGALHDAHRWKDSPRQGLKRVWEYICNMLVQRDSCVFHVTSYEEGVGSRARIPRPLAVVIPNGVEIPASLPSRRWVPGNVLRLLFIGRLHPKKGIENLFRAIRLASDIRLVLKVCGTGEAAYVDKLQRLARDFALEKSIHFLGHLDGESKTSAFLEADVCVAPSHNENFCMVVGEALAHGVPVIASTGTPWAAIERNGCGLWVDNDPDTLANAIRRIAKMDLCAMGAAGRAWMGREFAWPPIARQMYAVYKSLVRSDDARAIETATASGKSEQPQQNGLDSNCASKQHAGHPISSRRPDRETDKRDG